MYNANKPTASELPSTGKLLKSTGIAAAIAAGLLVTVVMPAEYGIDPTRVGSVFGLTEMGRIKVSLAAEAAAAAEASAAAANAVRVIDALVFAGLDQLVCGLIPINGSAFREVRGPPAKWGEV